MRRRYLVLAVFLVFVGSAAALTVWWRSYHRFDSARWKAVGLNYTCSNNRRQRMVGDLRAHHLRRGLAITQVKALLGPPSEIDHWPNKQLERQDQYDRTHSKKEFGLTPAQYAKQFPPIPLPQKGMTLSWITGGNGSDCTSIAVYFVNGRIAGVDRPI
jgi:hypothetical protein